VDLSSLVCPGSAGARGGRGSKLWPCSDAAGCTSAAELLPGKGLFPPLPGSRAGTRFRDGAAFSHKGERLDHRGTQQIPLSLAQVTRK